MGDTEECTTQFLMIIKHQRAKSLPHEKIQKQHRPLGLHAAFSWCSRPLKDKTVEKKNDEEVTI